MVSQRIFALEFALSSCSEAGRGSRWATVEEIDTLERRGDRLPEGFDALRAVASDRSDRADAHPPTYITTRKGFLRWSPMCPPRSHHREFSSRPEAALPQTSDFVPSVRKREGHALNGVATEEDVRPGEPHATPRIGRRAVSEERFACNRLPTTRALVALADGLDRLARTHPCACTCCGTRDRYGEDSIRRDEKATSS